MILVTDEKEIAETLQKSSIRSLSFENIERNLSEIETPYVLFLQENFDFRFEDANLSRMVREAERQNADVVSGTGWLFLYSPQFLASIFLYSPQFVKRQLFHFLLLFYVFEPPQM